ncbi:AAA family ATPase [Acinetobacter lwoffii]|uniref:AAA family ATPase n=1 Tax=Acinetobacter lwoffii TaxID=28090 RepID=UPI002096B373|nr:AAA family ATPase [Acinetobacter lwoffii]MCO8069829.1 AAA family ATPase [Acinetobacter lwoffii]
MKITKISLTNFRAFKQTQTIEFAPVTLLFGPNSVGKSTVLKALFYVQQILSKGQCNPMYLDALNKKYIGGFENLVHKRDLDTNITLKIEYEKGDAIGSSYVHLADILGDVIDLQMGSPIIDANKVAIEFEISWSKFEITAYIKTYKIWFDESLIAEVSSTSGSKQAFITALNYAHKLLQPLNQAEWIEAVKEAGGEIHPFLEGVNAEQYYKKIEDSMHKEPDIDFDEIDFDESELLYSTSDSAFLSQFHEILNEDADDSLSDNMFMLDSGFVGIHQPIGIDVLQGALPKLGQKLKTSLDLDDSKLTEVVNEILSDVVVAPLDNLLSILNQSLCIGPIRKIIDANYQPLPYVEQSDWYDGSAAWSNLLKTDFADLRRINSWMVDEDKLNLGYGINIKVESIFSQFKNVDNFSNVREMFKELTNSIDTNETDVNLVFDMMTKILKGNAKAKNQLNQMIKLVKHDTNTLNENLKTIHSNGPEFIDAFLKLLKLVKDYVNIGHVSLTARKAVLMDLLSRTEWMMREEIYKEELSTLKKLKKYLEAHLEYPDRDLEGHEFEAKSLMLDLGLIKSESRRIDNLSYTIWDYKNDISVLPNEIGTGVSQLMPLIVAAINQKGGLVACEQPELHLHPRVQVAIGDLLIQNTEHVNYLIETHSEHLILRLLKRIRQNTDNELPEGFKAFTKEEIAINYLEPSKEGVKVKKIRIDDDGEFKDRWPQGFFSERKDELM